MLTILQVFPQYCSWISPRISRIYMLAWPRLTFNENAYQLDPMEKEKNVVPHITFWYQTLQARIIIIFFLMSELFSGPRVHLVLACLFNFFFFSYFLSRNARQNSSKIHPRFIQDISTASWKCSHVVRRSSFDRPGTQVLLYLTEIEEHDKSLQKAMFQPI
jgi:hypothetical protein